MTTSIDSDKITTLLAVAHSAAAALRRHDRNIASKLKQDRTSVTGADITSHQMIVGGLRAAFGPAVSILSEEGVGEESLYHPNASEHIIVDPLDGTSNFKAGKKDYSVLIAVARNGRPICGIATFPDYEKTLFGNVSTGKLEWINHTSGVRTPIDRQKDSGKSRVVIPQRFIDVPATETEEQRAARQAGLQCVEDFQRVTRFGASQGVSVIWGSALPVLDPDVAARYYRAPRPTERPGDWDLAAWEAILESSGGTMSDLAGRYLRYGDVRTEFKHDGFVCWKDKASEGTYQRSCSMS